ncbi:uncharacterized protein LOC144098122 [Amblyomma americanum]
MEKKSPSQWTEPRELLAAQQRPGPPPPKPEQYLGIDASTLYSLSLQSDATDRGSQWAPFVYACGLLVLIFGFLLIYYLSRASERTSALRGSGGRKMTYAAETTDTLGSSEPTGQPPTAASPGGVDNSTDTTTHGRQRLPDQRPRAPSGGQGNATCGASW